KLNEPRMPLILDERNVQTWLDGKSHEIESLMKPSEVEIKAHTVKRLKGRNALGNIVEVQEEYHYSEMEDPLMLF
ncbi:SOS response-associated peptidase, partial [Crocinitomicaceae bacterium]|nr:SOS response-associated peptidase [Crocinitomicaceae bacterium]